MWRKVLKLILVIVLIFGVYGVVKKLPAGVGLTGTLMSVSAVQLLTDKSFVTAEGVLVREQEIFDYILKMIDEAEEYILIDMFLYNDNLGKATTSYRALSSELTNALIEKKSNYPSITIQVISDSINTGYGGYVPEQWQNLEESGISVIVTDLTKLRDSNPLYSAWWRAGLRFVPDIGGAWLPNLLDTTKPKVGISSYLRALNFKANHRKLIVTDYEAENGKNYRTLITSFNPHDGSSEHSNVAVVIDGLFALEVIASEAAVANFSGYTLLQPDFATVEPALADTEVLAELLTERAIKDSLLSRLAVTKEGDHILMAMFYFSDRAVLRALGDAVERGATLSVLLDPNKNAFGREKNGIPNRQIAHALVSRMGDSSVVRWCATNGEQCHSKLVLIDFKDSNTEIFLGSANLTRRNLDNYNLETNVRLVAPTSHPVTQDARAFFMTQWNNEGGSTYSHPYEKYADKSLFKTIWYRIGEFTGMSHY